tara:strand:- start:557 stop:1381 length:825 start_codon:yes stop_codon:yes gene_type:complete
MNLKKRFTKKRFGQHWLINEKILEKIRQTANLDEDDFILEIGPGRGALTSRLLDSKIRGLHAVELDKDLIEFLTKKFSVNEKFSLQQGDILKINFENSKYEFTKVVANIPYNISSPILEKFLGGLGEERKNNIKNIIFLMQKDIVDRIIANEGDSNNGAISTRIKLISTVEKICDISPSAFYPEPKVYSSLVVFKPLPSNLRLDFKLEKYIDNLLKVTFSARRKKIKNTITSILSKEDIERIEIESGISFDLRPQELSIEQWINIAKLCININN